MYSLLCSHQEVVQVQSCPTVWENHDQVSTVYIIIIPLLCCHKKLISYHWFNSLDKQHHVFLVLSTVQLLLWEKKEIGLSPMPTPTEKSQKQRDNMKRHQNLCLRNECGPTRTVSWSNNSYPTGVVKPVSMCLKGSNWSHLSRSTFCIFFHRWRLNYYMFSCKQIWNKYMSSCKRIWKLNISRA